jgi:hypothetical protein
MRLGPFSPVAHSSFPGARISPPVAFGGNQRGRLLWRKNATLGDRSREGINRLSPPPATENHLTFQRREGIYRSLEGLKLCMSVAIIDSLRRVARELLTNLLWNPGSRHR